MTLKKFKVKVEKFGVEPGSVVSFDDDPNKDTHGRSGKMLCSIPSGGALFYTPDELEEISNQEVNG